jgi:hypothetical protein
MFPKNKLAIVIDGLNLLIEAPLDHPDRHSAIVQLYQNRHLAQSILDVVYREIQQQKFDDLVAEKATAIPGARLDN